MSSSSNNSGVMSLIDICVELIVEGIINRKFSTVGRLPDSMAQLILRRLSVCNRMLYSFVYRLRHCSLATLDVHHGAYDWMELVKCFDECLVNLSIGYCSAVNNKSFEWLSSFHQLEKLTLCHCDRVTNKGLVRTLPNLHRLVYLKLDTMDVTNSLLAHIGKCLVWLEELHLIKCNRLSGTGLKNLKSLTHLTSLTLSKCPKIHGDNALEFMTHLALLEVLVLRDTHQVNDKSLAFIRNLRCLKRVDLYGCVSVTDAGLADSFYNVEHLEYVCLSRTGVGRAFLTKLADKATKLRTLHMAQTSPSEEALVTLLPRIVSLVHLSLRGCESVTDQVLLSLFPLENMRTLNITDCPDVDLTGDHIRCTFRRLHKLQARSCSWSDTGVGELDVCQDLTFLDMSFGLGPIQGEFEQMSNIRHLTFLDISSTELNGSDLESVSQLAQLVTLRLKYVDAHELWTVDDVRPLQNLTTLRELNLSYSTIRDEHLLAFLPAICGQLTFLHMKYCYNISDVGAEALSGCRRLQRLSVQGVSKLSDAACEFVGSIGRSLHFLDMSHCKAITTGGAMKLSPLISLRELNLGGCTLLTDDALDVLEVMEGLQFVRIEGTLLSNYAIHRLTELSEAFGTIARVVRKSSSSKCKVYWSSK